MKLLALLTDGIGGLGGIARYNCNLLAALSASPAIESVLVLPRFGDASAPMPPKVEQLTALPSRWSWTGKATSVAFRRRFDTVFCGHLNAAPLAAALSEACGTKLWLQAHGIEAWAPGGRILRHSVERADLITCVSRFTRSRLLSWAAIPPERVRVLPNTFAGTFRTSPRPEIADRLGILKRKVVLTVGRLASAECYKGHDRIMRALPIVAQSYPTITYVIVGSGDDQTRLAQLASDLGIAERVIFVGHVTDKELPNYFALADVFAMPSTGEGFGIVFLEAARMGLPIVGGSEDGSADALADGVIGHMVSPENTPALAEALIAGLRGQLASNPNEAQRFCFRNFSMHLNDLVESLAAPEEGNCVSKA